MNSKIAVVGIGYVGMSLATLLSAKNKVIALDIDPHKVEQINKNISTVPDPDIETFIKKNEISLVATRSALIAFKDAEFIVICTPTDYDPVTNSFDTSTVEKIISEARDINTSGLIVIKSTIPVGFCERLQMKFSTKKIIFCPEFLREGKALHDNLFPSRIIIGSDIPLAIKFSKLLISASAKKTLRTLFMSSREAEATKLFANTYLAMRIAFFNELDSFALESKLNTKNIIDGICSDERIGDYYNNPSFGYGGYCLPKDTQQLLSSYNYVPQDLIQAIVSSNQTRKNFIAETILCKNPKIVGIYRLAMKKDSGNFRSSSIRDIMIILQKNGVETIIFEPNLKEPFFMGSIVFQTVKEFKKISDLIIANRHTEEIRDVEEKVFTRDIFFRD